MVTSVIKGMEKPDLNIIPSHLISKSNYPFSFTTKAQHPHDECPAIVTGFPSLLSVNLTLVKIVNVSIFPILATPGRSFVSRTTSFPLNLNPGSAIHKKISLGSESSSKETMLFLR